MKYPIGIQDFKSIRTEGFVYVDKTAYIDDLVHNGKPYFLSRPRRFGKSMLLSTIRYYFQGEKELFEGLAISKTEKEWKKYPVITLAFNTIAATDKEGLISAIECTLSEWELKYGIENQYKEIGQRFEYLIKQISEKTNEKVVILVDEYDAILLETWGTPEEQDVINVFSKFFSAFKNADSCIRFLLITGVTKFSHVTLFSGANQLKDISMDARYEAICGITQEELTTNFTEGIHNLADSLGCSYDNALARLKKRYDGYHFSKRLADIYNPFSLLRALDEGELRDYWFSTGSTTALVKAVGNVQNVNVEKMTEDYLAEAVFVDYKATKENLLPLFYQSGYLTIKDVNKEQDDTLYKLGFPNEEVSRAYSTLMLDSFFFSENETSSSWIMGVKDAIQKGNTRKLRQHIRALFADIPYEARPPKEGDNYRVFEGYFHTAMFLVFKISATYMVVNEKMNAKGRADCVIETPNYVYIWEFKLDRPASLGTRQIEKRDYAAPYAADSRKLFRISASFSSQDLTLRDWQENGVPVDLSEDEEDEGWS